MINEVSIEVDGLHYIAILKDEDDLFFIVPIEKDDSDNWVRLQEWFDEGNAVGQDLRNACNHYVSQRVVEYPSVVEQLDYIYHNGVDAWKSDIIDPIKAKYPKPIEE